MLYLICAHLFTSARINMSFNSGLICISQPCLRPYCATMVCLRAHPYVRCAKMIGNGAVTAISAAQGANINITSHISAHHLGPDFAEKMRKKSEVCHEAHVAPSWISLCMFQTWKCQIITLIRQRQLTMAFTWLWRNFGAIFTEMVSLSDIGGFLSTNWPFKVKPTAAQLTSISLFLMLSVEATTTEEREVNALL